MELYVQAINTPGMVPNVQNAWDQFVETKCSDAMKDALNAYRATMVLQLKDKLPCDNDLLRTGHALALENSSEFGVILFNKNIWLLLIKLLRRLAVYLDASSRSNGNRMVSAT